MRSNISVIISDLDKDGYWFSTTSWTFPNKLSHPLAMKYFQLTEKDFTGKDFECAGTFVGLKRGTPAIEGVLKKWVDCALVLDCIAPPTSDITNHRQDQTALNFILYGPNGFRKLIPENILNVHTEWKYFAYDDDSSEDIILFTRRRAGKPFPKYIEVVTLNEIRAIDSLS